MHDVFYYAGSGISSAYRPSSMYEGLITSIQTSMAGNDQEVVPKTRWVDSIKHDLHSPGLNTTLAVRMVFYRSLWNDFVDGLPTLESEQCKVSQVLLKWHC